VSGPDTEDDAGILVGVTFLLAEHAVRRAGQDPDTGLSQTLAQTQTLLRA
jgi:hypothetical protein